VSTAASALEVDVYSRIYAGVLGKIIGVYLGRPFEGWSHERIERELGEIWDYVHERLGQPLVVTDDDITGTFTFFRALEENGYPQDLTPEQVGETWMNRIIEGRTILWWGGMGMSTEHTAYLRMKAGILPPESGSIARNGTVVAEQIGAQIFIDAWGLASPGDPDQAARLAEAAGRVSHDGEAAHAAKLLAAMIAAAFEERDLDRLLETGLSTIPADSIIATIIRDLRQWRKETDDWREALRRLDRDYGYHRYGGNCHVVPNHGVIILALLYGDLDFDRSLMIANTCGWDTDCNSGNVGCLLGVIVGPEGIGDMWRDPVADRLLLPTTDGSRFASDAVREADAIFRAAHRLRNLPYEPSKGGARFHFSLPGSVQGFVVADRGEPLRNKNGALTLPLEGSARRAFTPTFLTDETVRMRGYEAIASPALWPGQLVQARLSGDNPSVEAALCVRAVTPTGERVELESDWLSCGGEGIHLVWRVPADSDLVITEVGFAGRGQGKVCLDRLDWAQIPGIDLRYVPNEPFHARSYVDAVSHLSADETAGSFRAIQNDGTGLVLFGDEAWNGYSLEAEVTPHLVTGCGLAVGVRGLRRYLALRVVPDRVQLVRTNGATEVLAESPFSWHFGQRVLMQVSLAGDRLAGAIEGGPSLEVRLPAAVHGAAGLLVADGRCAFAEVRLRSANPIGSA
jgi:ADP-ribosylglycohydrolase